MRLLALVLALAVEAPDELTVRVVDAGTKAPVPGASVWMFALPEHEPRVPSVETWWRPEPPPDVLDRLVREAPLCVTTDDDGRARLPRQFPRMLVAERGATWGS
jgi:hypothetical protein